MYYCSKEHQEIAWQSHKQQCKLLANEELIEESCDTSRECVLLDSVVHTLPEYDIVIEEEPGKQVLFDGDKERVQGELERMMNDMQFDQKEEEEEDTQVNVDSIFIKFQKRVEREPNQVIRIAQLESDLPLWVNVEGKPLMSDIGVCECGGRRVFEYQVMPQLICHLDQGNDRDSMDWGSLFVYTCELFCNNHHHHNNGYVEHFVWKQDFSSDGMKNPNDEIQV